MFKPSQAFDTAIQGINDFMTSPAKKAQLTYQRAPTPAPTATSTYKFRTPNAAAITQGKNNAQDVSKLPRGTTIGAPQTSQSKALTAKLK